MNTQIEPKMQAYVATRNFSLGNPSINIQKGMSLQFDGYTLVLAGRPPQSIPQFKGAVKMGWVVVPESYDPNARIAARSAGIQVRPADGGNPNERKASTLITTAQAEEQVVGDVQAHAAGVREGNQTNYRRSVEVEGQDGTIVRTLQTPANRDANRVIMEGGNTQAAIRQANSVQIQPGKGRSREEIMAAMTPEQRANYEAQIASRKLAYVEPVSADQQGPSVVADIMAPSSEIKESMGVTTVTTVGGGTETVDLSGLDTAPAETQVIESEGMKFTVTNGPKKDKPTPAPVSNDDPRRVIAKAICADFPDLYDFEAPPRKKIARLQADFEDRPDVIRAVAAAETDAEVRARLVEEFPNAFASA